MPRTKSKSQTRQRGTTIPNRRSTRTISTGRAIRSKERARERELSLRGPNVVGASQRNQAERAYRGDIGRRFDVARGKRLSSTKTAVAGRKSRRLRRAPARRRRSA